MTQANNNGNIEAVTAVHEQHEDDLLELYTSFINSYDGSSDAFEKSEPFMNDLFHPDFIFSPRTGRGICGGIATSPNPSPRAPGARPG